MEFTAILKKSGKHYVALCLEVDVVSQGRTQKKALENLKEAVHLYIEEEGFPDEFQGKAKVAHFVVQQNAIA